MNRAGYAMLGFDLRGHGRSGGRRGDAPSYEALMDDIELLVRGAGSSFPRLPLFLYGHSMGGNLVLNYALRRNPDLVAIIVTGPGLKPTSVGSRFKVFAARLLRFVTPALLVSNEVDPKYLSRDAEVVRKYMTDPLVHDRVSIRLGLGLVDAGTWALQHAGDFDRPLLLLQGGADRVVDVQTNLDFAKSVGHRCRLEVWPRLYHEIHNEPEKEEVFKGIVDWLDRHAK
jgi:alpha-beta hydrolase superfamily lysophospholipase